MRLPRTAIGVVAIAALLGGLTLGPAPSVEAQATGAQGVWRSIFKRAARPPAPADNPLTDAKIALGATLFVDARLSGNGQRSCATCHRPDRAFTDGRPRAEGISGTALKRNTPALYNLAWGKQFFWDGRVSSLEEQVGLPIVAADEMGGHWPTILARLGEDADLVADFRDAFGEEEPLSQRNVTSALASYVRSLVSPATRFDAWIEGDPQALSAAELRGFRLFTGKGACMLCHAGWRFTDDKFHDIGLRSTDGGRGLVPGGTPGLMAFKTPSLRELTRTAPYMHDGSLATLSAVVDHYAGGFVRRSSLAPSLRRDLRLSAREKSDLVAFLQALSSGEKKPAREGRAGRR
jgi:cytochrome c peroxidase